MADSDDENDQFPLLQFIDDPIVSHTDSIGELGSREFSTPGRAGIGCQTFERGDDSRQRFALDPPEILLGATRQFDPEGIHRRQDVV
jgi:hypothetical protein